MHEQCHSSSFISSNRDVGQYDRIVIQDILKEIAQTQQVDLNAKQKFKGSCWSRLLAHSPHIEDEAHDIHDICSYSLTLHSVRYLIVVVINEADSLSRDAQAALRRTMEKYMGNLRIILCAESTSQIIGPIRSRCLLMRVGAPTIKEVGWLLLGVGIRWDPLVP